MQPAYSVTGGRSPGWNLSASTSLACNQYVTPTRGPKHANATSMSRGDETHRPPRLNCRLKSAQIVKIGMTCIHFRKVAAHVSDELDLASPIPRVRESIEIQLATVGVLQGRPRPALPEGVPVRAGSSGWRGTRSGRAARSWIACRPGRRASPRARVLRSSIVSLGTVIGLPSAVMSRTSLSSSPRKYAGVDLAVAGGQHDRLESLGDLFVGVDDRFEHVGAGLAGADAGKLGADLAADGARRSAP